MSPKSEHKIPLCFIDTLYSLKEVLYDIFSTLVFYFYWEFLLHLCVCVYVQLSRGQRAALSCHHMGLQDHTELCHG